MINQLQLEEMVWDKTVGSGDNEISTTNLVQSIEKQLGVKLNVVQERIVQRKHRLCQLMVEFP